MNIKIAIIIYTLLVLFECDNIVAQQATKKVTTDDLYDYLDVVSDTSSGFQKARESDKLVLLYFTGHKLPNAERYNYELFLEDEIVLPLLKEHFINIWLYVDDKSCGRKWTQYEKERFHSISQPFIVILDSHGNIISEGVTYPKQHFEFKEMLLNALK